MIKLYKKIFFVVLVFFIQGENRSVRINNDINDLENSQNIGCMDDGLQAWSPYPGSPACNYDQNAIINATCYYSDCNGCFPPECADYVSMYDSSCNYIGKENYAVHHCSINGFNYNSKFDCQNVCNQIGGICYQDGTNKCGECGTGVNNCLDCNNVIHGTAYIDGCGICVESFETDCSSSFNLGIDSLLIYVPDTVYTIPTYIPTDSPLSLESLDIELHYNRQIFEVTEFSINNTVFKSEYKISYHTSVIGDNNDSLKSIFTMYFEPTSSNSNIINENIGALFYMTINPFDIMDDISTQIIVKQFKVNEKKVEIPNISINIELLRGCMDQSACNYDSNVGKDDGSCKYESDCFGVCGGKSILDECNVCDGEDPPGDDNGDGSLCDGGCDEYDCSGECKNENCSNNKYMPGCAELDECGVCVFGTTSRVPCVEDCNGILGGNAYLDGCGNCVQGSSGNSDCLNAGFKFYNSNLEEIIDFKLKKSEYFYTILHINNLPDSLIGIDLLIDYESFILELSDWRLHTNIVENKLIEIDSIWVADPDWVSQISDWASGIVDTNSYNIETLTINPGNIESTIYLNSDNPICCDQDNVDVCGICSGNILFLKFKAIGDIGSQSVLSINSILINENPMKSAEEFIDINSNGLWDNGEEFIDYNQNGLYDAGNFSSNIFYIADCNGDLNGVIEADECGVCFGSNDCLSNNFSSIVSEFSLDQNYPNPFNPITYINYSIPNYDFVNINIININGQLIKTLVKKFHQPGMYEVLWDSTNEYGLMVPSGIYFYKMQSTEYVSIKKLILLK